MTDDPTASTTGRAALRVATVTISDTRTSANDTSGVAIAQQTIDTGTVALIVGSVPLWLALLDRIFLGQRLVAPPEDPGQHDQAADRTDRPVVDGAVTDEHDPDGQQRVHHGSAIQPADQTGRDPDAHQEQSQRSVEQGVHTCPSPQVDAPPDATFPASERPG